MRQNRSFAILLLGSVLLASTVGLPSLAAAQTRAVATAHPDMTGIWEHTATSKLKRDPVPWTPLARKLLDEDVRDHWPNGVSDENAYCLPAGMPFMMSGSEGFTLVQSPSQMTLINEERPSPRFFYIGGQHPNPKDFELTTVGHSIAHWEGDTLVADTVGFLPGPTVQWIRSDKTHLVEAYHLEDGGQHLRITFTWDDPTLLSKPYSYTYVMERAPPGRYTLEYYCDPRDPARKEG